VSKFFELFQSFSKLQKRFQKLFKASQELLNVKKVEAFSQFFEFNESSSRHFSSNIQQP
jgi:hypothetical protein